MLDTKLGGITGGVAVVQRLAHSRWTFWTFNLKIAGSMFRSWTLHLFHVIIFSHKRPLPYL